MKEIKLEDDKKTPLTPKEPKARPCGCSCGQEGNSVNKQAAAQVKK